MSALTHVPLNDNLFICEIFFLLSHSNSSFSGDQLPNPRQNKWQAGVGFRSHWNFSFRNMKINQCEIFYARNYILILQLMFYSVKVTAEIREDKSLHMSSNNHLTDGGCRRQTMSIHLPTLSTRKLRTVKRLMHLFTEGWKYLGSCLDSFLVIQIRTNFSILDKTCSKTYSIGITLQYQSPDLNLCGCVNKCTLML